VRHALLANCGEGFFMSTRRKAGSHAAHFTITYHGTVATVDALSDACLSWIEENVEVEPWQRLGVRRIAIDPRVVEELRHALREAGFVDSDAEGERRQIVGKLVSIIGR
jgi:hypothetical protein